MGNECMTKCPDHPAYWCELSAFHTGDHKTFIDDKDRPGWPIAFNWQKEGAKTDGIPRTT